MDLLHQMNGAPCSCGREHRFHSRVIVGSGVLVQLPDAVRELRAGKAYVLSDENTFAAAGSRVCDLLHKAGIGYVHHCFGKEPLEPDERSVGSAIMHYEKSCDVIIGVGSGVINDIGKIVSNVSGKPYIIVATAPSMDGYASASSSMTRDGLKISLLSRCADVILGDTDILCLAPMELMRAGLGDMLAKFVSICEWRIANLITGEYYCPQVAELIRQAVQRCVQNADGLLRREEAAVRAVFEGLVIGGVAMNYAGVSRPASGVEHYISHVLDMRGVEYGLPVAHHGTQCAVGTLIAIRLYEKLAAITPDREKALHFAENFNLTDWNDRLRKLVGKGAESMIALEEKDGKYDIQKHAPRLDRILTVWNQILTIIHQEMPCAQELEQLLDRVGLPKTLAELGTEEGLLPEVFRATKDIRDKYVLSRLCWDLGVLEEIL